MGDTSLIFSLIARNNTAKGLDKAKTALVGFGVAAGAALAAAFGQALEKSKMDGMLAAQLGASPAQAQALGKLSGAVFADNFGDDLPQVSDAIRAAAQSGLVDVKNAGSAASKATVESLLTVSKVLGEDTQRTSVAVQQMLRTGLAGSAQEAMDILVSATQNGVNKSEDLLDTINEYGTQFRKLGLDGKTAMGLVSQAIKAGARDSDTAADAIKEFSIRAIDGSKGTTAAYKALGLNAKTMTKTLASGGAGAEKAFGTVLDKLRAIKDPAQQAQVATALFGTKAEDLGKALFAMDTGTAAKSMGDFAGATKKAADTMASGPGAKLDALKRKIQAAFVTQLGKAVPYIDKTFGWLSRNSGWVIPLAVALGTVGVAIYAIVTATKIWTAVQTALDVVLNANPIGLIVIAIAALVGAIVWIATKTTWFQDLWHWIWSKIGDPVKAIWGWIKTNWPYLVGMLAGPIGIAVAWVIKHWDTVKAAASAVVRWIVDRWHKFTDFWSRVWATMKAAPGLMWNFVKSKALEFHTFVVSKVNNLVNFIKGLPGRIATAGRNMFSSLSEGFRGAINWIIGKWNGLSFTLPAINAGPIHIPGYTLSTPNIPYLAQGGIIPATRGGRLAVIGEGGHDEAVVPLPRGLGSGLGGDVTLRVEASSDTEMTRLLVELIRRFVRVQGRGSVQTALGRG